MNILTIILLATTALVSINAAEPKTEKYMLEVVKIENESVICTRSGYDNAPKTIPYGVNILLTGYPKASALYDGETFWVNAMPDGVRKLDSDTVPVLKTISLAAER